MRTITLVDAREELLHLKTEGSKGGESLSDEVQTMGPTSVSMLLTLALHNTRKIIGSISIRREQVTH